MDWQFILRLCYPSIYFFFPTRLSPESLYVAAERTRRRVYRLPAWPTDLQRPWAAVHPWFPTKWRESPIMQGVYVSLSLLRYCTLLHMWIEIKCVQGKRFGTCTEVSSWRLKLYVKVKWSNYMRVLNSFQIVFISCLIMTKRHTLFCL